MVFHRLFLFKMALLFEKSIVLILLIFILRNYARPRGPMLMQYGPRINRATVLRRSKSVQLYK